MRYSFGERKTGSVSESQLLPWIEALQMGNQVEVAIDGNEHMELGILRRRRVQCVANAKGPNGTLGVDEPFEGCELAWIHQYLDALSLEDDIGMHMHRSTLHLGAPQGAAPRTRIPKRARAHRPVRSTQPPPSASVRSFASETS